METKDYPTGVLIKRLLSVMKHLLPYIGVAVLFAVLGFVVTVAIPSYLVWLAFSALAGQTLSLWHLLALVVLALARGAFRYGEHYFGHFVAFHSLADLRKLIFAKLRRLAPAKLDGQDSGHLLKMIGEDIEALEIFFAHTIAPICTGTITAVLALMYFGNLQWGFAVIALVTYALLAVFLPNQFAKKLQPHLQAQNKARTAYMSVFLESLKAMRDLVQFGRSEERFRQLTSQSNEVNHLERQVALEQVLQQVLTDLVVGLSLTAFALWGIFTIGEGQLTVVQATIALAGFSSSFAPFLELGRLPLGFKRAMNAGRHVFTLLDEAEPAQSGQVVPVQMEQVAISGLNFQYDNREQAIFKDFSAHFETGKIIGLVGASGSGKSTLMKLIMRWYDAQAGRIELTGQEVKEIDRRHLQGSIAYVPQIAQLFHQSLRENLLLGRTDISDEEIWNLAERCHMKERLEKLPEGLDTVIDGEADFSAGERQRLELMRALLKKVDAYIFDEPTSNLDALNEAAFLSIVREECKGMVFLISHRQSTVNFADEVYELTPSQVRKLS